MSEQGIGTPGFCQDCPYWGAPSPGVGNAICRRYPPSAGAGFGAAWPTTSPAQWCGEHPVRKAQIEAWNNPSEQTPEGGDPAALRQAPAEKRRRRAA